MPILGKMMSSNDKLDVLKTDDYVNSAIFESSFVRTFLSVYDSYEYVTINKTTLGSGDESLKMFISDQNGNFINGTTHISAAFPCPDFCNTLTISSITGNFTFSIDLLKDVLNQQSLHLTGLAFHSANSGVNLAMYAAIIVPIYPYAHIRFDQISAGHRVYLD